jgi:hypothetical protein
LAWQGAAMFAVIGGLLMVLVLRKQNESRP